MKLFVQNRQSKNMILRQTHANGERHTFLIADTRRSEHQKSYSFKTSDPTMVQNEVINQLHKE
uniref:Uncharacterized protein n=1 Tax=Anopheles albimanus TaxID=7167 RepID=A0A182FYS1_ANOAL